jgi:hypothetical protein
MLFPMTSLTASRQILLRRLAQLFHLYGKSRVQQLYNVHQRVDKASDFPVVACIQLRH